MLSEKVTLREQKELDKVLKAFEQIQSDNIREFFRVSRLSSEDFVEGILEFSESDQQGMVNAMLEDEILALVLGDKFENWHETPQQLRRTSLEVVYDILYVESKIVSSLLGHSKVGGMSPTHLKSAVVNLIEEMRPTSKKMLVNYMAAVAIGDHHGSIGIGFGESKRDRRHCIDKAVKVAKSHIVFVPLVGGTLPCEVSAKHEGTEVYMRPADPGTGIISEDCLPIVLHQAGIKDLFTEIRGSHSRIGILKATMKSFSKLAEYKHGVIP